ncbi:MAG TPA: ester cyclase [Mycobacterium sp.]|jgi:predicted ester cyclase
MSTPLIAGGDKVVGRTTGTGTHSGEFMGLAPTGRSVAYNEIFIFRFVDGRVAETWGVVAAPGPSRCSHGADGRVLPDEVGRAG